MIYFCMFMFIIHLIGVGVYASKVGEVKVTYYTQGDVIASLLIATWSGIAILMNIK